MLRSGLLVVAMVISGWSAWGLVSRAQEAEEGWIDLIARTGADLKGWTRVPIPPDGKLSDVNQWSIDPETGYLVCTGKGGHDWLRWDEEFGDCIFQVEWRFTDVPGTTGYNSGMYARNSADGRIWHQAQMGPASGGYLFGETEKGGKLEFFSLDKQVTGKPVKPPGEWNAFEMRARGREMILTVNGEVTGTWRECEVPRGFVGVEAEGYRIEFRKLRVKPL
jgi:hypothetical protein